MVRLSVATRPEEVAEMLEGFIVLGGVIGFDVLALWFARSGRDGEDWTVRYGPHLTAK